MALFKKIIIGILSTLLFIFLVDFGLNFWIDKKLPKIISEQNDSRYSITYKNLEVSVWSGNIRATEIIVVPKSSIKSLVQKNGIYTIIKSFEIKEFKLFSLLFNNKIQARSIIINYPLLVLYKKDEKAINHSKSIRSQIIDPFQKIITVSDIYLNHGDFKILYIKNNTPILKVQNINVQIEGIAVSDETLKNNIPFSYKKYSFECDSVFYHPNQFYNLSAIKCQTISKGLKISKLAFLPQCTRKEFTRKISKEKDLYTCTADSLKIENIKWGFKEDVLFFNCSTIILDKLSANIYRGKMPDDDLKKKHLYNKLLRDIPFPLRIDTLFVRNSKVVYEEEVDFKKGAGVVRLDRFNIKASPVQSGYGQKKMDDLKIKINCRFMETAPLVVDWRLNVLDKSDGFKIKGKIKNLNMTQLYPFAKPYMNASVTGVFEEMTFDFKGNDRVSKGNLDLKYHDLKVTLFKKNNPEKKSKLKSFFANLFVKNDSKGQKDSKASEKDVKTIAVEVERIPEKSFYNFLWRSIMEGLKKIII
ncbi:MAG: hypothetical protein V4548_13320 [Bacteroidota bacterium]